MNYLTITYDELTKEILKDTSTILVKTEAVCQGGWVWPINTHVFKRANKYWAVTARFSSKDGEVCPDFGKTVEAIEVEPIPVTTIKWEVVNNVA